MRMGRKFCENGKKKRMMVWMEIFQSGFFNAGICEADRQKRLFAVFSFRQQGGDSVYTGGKMEKRRGRQGAGSFPGEGYKKAARYNQNIENGRGR